MENRVPVGLYDDENDDNDNADLLDTGTRDEFEIRGDNISFRDIPAKGALLTGAVFGARHLPLGPPLLSPTDGASGSTTTTPQKSRCFFRVVYTEKVSSVSSMFACKTPVFSSEAVDVDHRGHGNDGSPSWMDLDHTFNFELVNPLVDRFEVQGELIVTLYRTKPLGGGNEVVGETSFNLAELVKVGDVVDPFPGTRARGRSIHGTFPIVARQTGASTATTAAWYDTEDVILLPELDMRLDVLWLDGEIATTATVTPALDTRRIGNFHNKDASSVRSSVGGGSVTGNNARPLSASRLRVAGGSVLKSVASRPQSAANTSAGGASGSMQGKKKREDAMRIDRENKILAAKLAKHSNNSNSGNNNGCKGGAYQVSASAPALSSNNNNNKISKLSDKELSETLIKLKQDVAATERANAALRATVSKHKVTAKKLELLNTKIKAALQAQPQTIPTYNINCNNNNTDNGSVTSKATTNAAVTRESYIQSALAQFEVSNVDAAKDRELSELLEEYGTLQVLRRALVDRATHSRMQHLSAQSETDASVAANVSAMRRLAATYPHNLVSAFQRLYSLANNSSNGVISVEEEKEEAYVMESWRKANRARVHAEMLHVDPSHSALRRQQDDDDIAELQAIQMFLETHKQRITEDTERANREADYYKDQLALLKGLRVSHRLRDGIQQLRVAHSRLRQRVRQQVLDDQHDKIQLAILQQKMKTEERKLQFEDLM